MVTAVGALIVVLSGMVAVLATRPRLAAKVFGPSTAPERRPSDLGLDATDIEYAAGARAWWIPAPSATASVVIVHGYEPTDDPRSTDPGPRLDVASMLNGHGFESLVVNLGYASGQHLHSGGELEAEDVAAAVEWARRRTGRPVAVIGFSAGGHAGVAAASRCSPFAVVTDSSFVDFGEVVKNQGSVVFGVPEAVFGLVPTLMRLMTGRRVVDLEADVDQADIPMLHIHGETDTAIDQGNLGRLATVTGGETLSIPDAEHVDAFRIDPITYEAIVVDFLSRSLAAEVAEA